MKALVLEKKNVLRIRDIAIEETLGPDDVRIAPHTVGVCGSDVHFYEYGQIGPFVVREPLVLGHEASGIVVETGKNVTSLKVGDAVCMEPGIPNWQSRASRMGLYNLDPAVRFWAAPPVHGCLRETVVHPAVLTFKLPPNVTPAEGALVEPLAVGLHAVNKAGIRPGDTAVVVGAGTIGLLAVASALAGGCSRVVVIEPVQARLDLAAKLGAVTTVNPSIQKPTDVIQQLTHGWGADVVFEASGHPEAVAGVFDLACPGGKVVFIGCPVKAVPMEMVKAQVKELTLFTIFRYAHIYPRALALMDSGKIDVKPFITDVFDFDHAVEAFDYARRPKPTSVKVQIVMP